MKVSVNYFSLYFVMFFLISSAITKSVNHLKSTTDTHEDQEKYLEITAPAPTIERDGYAFYSVVNQCNIKNCPPHQGFCQSGDVCRCTPGYLHSKFSKTTCDYVQKNRNIAAVLESFFGFIGAGHWYMGSYIMGGIKIGLFTVMPIFFWITFCLLGCGSGEEFEVMVCGLTMILFWAWIIFYVVFNLIDIILIEVGVYKDGNGYPMFYYHYFHHY